MNATLWFIRETYLARLYSKLPPERHPCPEDEVWLPRSQIERTPKYPDGRHEVTLPDWLGEKKGL